MTPVQITEKIIDLIADPKHWTTGTAARKSDMVPVDVQDPDGCSFCSIGAMWKVNDDFTDYKVSEAYARKAKELFPDDEYTESMVDFNDHHTHEEVMAVWNETLKDLRTAEEMGV